MTIDEAIVRLLRNVSTLPFSECSEYEQATRLGIEALKRIKELHDILGAAREGLLPGETEE